MKNQQLTPLDCEKLKGFTLRPEVRHRCYSDRIYLTLQWRHEPNTTKDGNK